MASFFFSAITADAIIVPDSPLLRSPERAAKHFLFHFRDEKRVIGFKPTLRRPVPALPARAPVLSTAAWIASLRVPSSLEPSAGRTRNGERAYKRLIGICEAKHPLHLDPLVLQSPSTFQGSGVPPHLFA